MLLYLACFVVSFLLHLTLQCVSAILQDIDLEVTIRNRLVEADVEFEFALDHQSSFDFVGISSFAWKLSGGEEVTVPLKARIYSGGLYKLQSVRLKVIMGDSSVPYLFPLQWTVMAEDI